MFVATWMRVPPTSEGRKRVQLNTPANCHANTPPRTIGMRLACRNGARIVRIHSNANGGFWSVADTEEGDDAKNAKPLPLYAEYELERRSSARTYKDYQSQRRKMTSHKPKADPQGS